MLTMEISKHLKYWEDNILSEVHQIDTANAYNGNIKALKVLRRQSSFRGTTNRCSKCLQKKNGNIKALKVLRRQRSFRGTSNRCGKCIVIKHSSCNEKRGIIREETSLEDGRLALWSVML